MIRDMWSDGAFGKFMVLLIIILILLIPVAIWGAIEEEKQWQVYKTDYDCQATEFVKGHTSTGTGYGVMSNGQMGMVMTTSSTPNKTKWVCNNNTIHWR